MAETDVVALSTTADGATAWGPTMRGAMGTLSVVDGAANVACRRTIGTGAQQSPAGNHGHLYTAITNWDAGVRSVLTERVTQTGVAYTLVLTDAARLVERSNSAANTLTVPTNAAVPFPTGTTIAVLQYGTGTTTINGAGVALRSRGNALTLAGQYAMATLFKRAADEWFISGDVV